LRFLLPKKLGQAGHEEQGIDRFSIIRRLRIMKEFSRLFGQFSSDKGL
jgi:hypothetical protein